MYLLLFTTLFSNLALEIKNIKYTYMSVHLVRDGGEQNKEEFKTINPMGQVPAFILNDVTITQAPFIYYVSTCKGGHSVLNWS